MNKNTLVVAVCAIGIFLFIVANFYQPTTVLAKLMMVPLWFAQGACVGFGIAKTADYLGNKYGE